MLVIFSPLSFLLFFYFSVCWLCHMSTGILPQLPLEYDYELMALTEAMQSGFQAGKASVRVLVIIGSYTLVVVRMLYVT